VLVQPLGLAHGHVTDIESRSVETMANSYFQGRIAMSNGGGHGDHHDKHDKKEDRRDDKRDKKEDRRDDKRDDKHDKHN
jgi:hypothetical protein